MINAICVIRNLQIKNKKEGEFVEYNKDKINLISKLGHIGIIGVLITIISDFILLGKPGSAYEFLMAGTESMWDISTIRITVGTFIGVVVLPLQALGVVPVYFALKPSAKLIRLITVIPYAHAILMGVGFHTAYAFIGSGWKLNHRPEASLITSGLMEQYHTYWMILVVIMTVEIVVSSVIYTVIVGKGKTLFPRWMAIFSPVSVVAFTLPLVFLLPYPVGGYLGPACLNISTLLFFILTQRMISKRMKEAKITNE